MNHAPPAQRLLCRVFRCSRQPELYLYLRDDLRPDALPEALTARSGQLTEIMQLELHAGRRLARVDVQRVLVALAATGYFLQLPPQDALVGLLHDGD